MDEEETEEGYTTDVGNKRQKAPLKWQKHYILSSFALWLQRRKDQTCLSWAILLWSLGSKAAGTK